MDQAEWLALAKKGDLDAILGALFDGKIRDVGARIDVLAKRKPDARIAKALTAAVMKPPFTSTGSQPVLWTPLFTLLAKIGDAETLAQLAPLAPSYDRLVGAAAAGKMMQAKLRKLVTALEAKHGPARPARAAPKAKGPRTASTASLLEDILAAPDDDGPRAVLADLLVQRGNPRGEFITLQLARARGERGDPGREAALLAEHRRAWAGAIAGVIDLERAVFARGFLDSVLVNGHPAAKVAKTAGDPAWGTVRELACQHPKPKPLAVIGHPGMRALRKVTGLDPKAFIELASGSAALGIEEVEVLWLEEFRGRKPLQRAWTEAAGLPALVRLDVKSVKDDFGTMAFFWTGALAQRLDSLAFGVMGPSTWIPQLLAMGLTRPKRVVFDHYYELTPSRPGGALDRLAITYHPTDAPEWTAEMVVRTLEAIPAGALAALTVDAPPVRAHATRGPRLIAAMQRHAR